MPRPTGCTTSGRRLATSLGRRRVNSQGRKRRNRGTKKVEPTPELTLAANADSSVAERGAPDALEQSSQTAVVAHCTTQDAGLLRIPQVVQTSHSGPLPAPEDFAAYERALVGSCDRILKMAEKQQEFAHDLTRRRLDGDLSETRWGQVCAVLLALAGTTACVATAHMGADWRVSAALGAAAIGLLIVPFLRKRR